MNNVRNRLINTKRIVIKVGTSTLTYKTGKINFSVIDKLARVISDLVNQKKEVVLVTSGAIGVGTAKLKLDASPGTIKERQAVAAVGQCELMHIYSKFFSEYGHIVGQILLTRAVVGDVTGRQNVINTFETLLEREIIPIVNENDSVSIEELKDDNFNTFSENDTLAALVAKLINADLLIVLSDVDGFYDSDPKKNPNAKMITTINEITPEIEKCAEGAGSQRGTGGAITRLSAAKIAISSGVDMVIANGDCPDAILEIIKGKQIGSMFVAK